jgi:hypothetical protein
MDLLGPFEPLRTSCPCSKAYAGSSELPVRMRDDLMGRTLMVAGMLHWLSLRTSSRDSGVPSQAPAARLHRVGASTAPGVVHRHDAASEEPTVAVTTARTSSIAARVRRAFRSRRAIRQAFANRPSPLPVSNREPHISPCIVLYGDAVGYSPPSRSVPASRRRLELVLADLPHVLNLA